MWRQYLSVSKGARFISSSSRIAYSGQGAKVEKKYLNPTEYIEKKNIERIENQAFQDALKEEDIEYKPRTLSDSKINSITKRPLPLNVELLKYKPLYLPQTHGHQVASIRFKGYDEKDLERAAEFAARAAYYLGIPCKPIESLKTNKRLYTVIKSPFAQAKSKENFHRTTYHISIKAFDANTEIVDLWLSYINKYALEGVKYHITLHTRESVDFARDLDSIVADDLKLPEAYSDLDDPIAKKVQELLKSDVFKQHFDAKKH